MKSLSETHPTLYKVGTKPIPDDDHYSNWWDSSDIQSCTVDRAEHARLLKQKILDYEHDLYERIGTGIMPTKELQTALNRSWISKEEHEKEIEEEQEASLRNYRDGIKEGERRAMRRVKEAIKRQYASNLEIDETEWTEDERLAWGICKAIEKELGLDKDGEARK